MGDASFVQTNFLGGEWSLAAQGRMEREDYRAAMNLSLNGIPVETGAWSRRSGTLLNAPTRMGDPARVIELHFKTQNSYIMEFTDTHLRFHTDGHLVREGDITTITAVSATTPAVVDAMAHGFVTGDEIEFFYGSSNSPDIGIALLLGRQFIVTVIDPDTFSIEDSVTGDPFDGSTLTPNFVTYDAPSVQRVLTFITPYTTVMLPDLRTVQNDTVCFILHPTQEFRAVTIAVDETLGFVVAQFLDGPFMDPVEGISVTPDATSGTIELTASAAIFVSTDVGRQLRLFSEPEVYDAGTTYAKGDPVKYRDVYYTALQATTGDQPDISFTFWAVTPVVARWEWVLITAFTDSTHVDVVLGQAGHELPYTNEIFIWREGLYSDTTGWPTSGGFFQGRFWLAGPAANRVDGSMPNSQNVPTNVFWSPTGPDGTVADNNGISAIFAATDVNAVVWIVPVDRGLQVGTTGGEWLIQASTLNNPVTPTDIVANRVTRFRCANTPPVIAPVATVFIQAHDKNLIELVPDGSQGGKYEGANIALDAKHLTGRHGLERIAYQQETTPIIWASDHNGGLFSCTYKRQSPWASNTASFYGWAQHQFNAVGDDSGRRVRDLCGGPSPDGTIDAITLSTSEGEDPYWIETMARLFEEGDNPLLSFHLDHAKTPALGRVNFETPGDFNTTIVSLDLFGLWDLEGRDTQVFIGAVNVGLFTVVDGSIINISVVPTPEEGLLNDPYLRTFIVDQSTTYDQAPFGYSYFSTRRPGDDFWDVYLIPVLVGQTYLSKGQIVRPVTPVESGARNGPAFGKTRRIHQAAYMLNTTQDFAFGTSFNELEQAVFMLPGEVPYTDLQLFTGTMQATINDNYNIDASQLCWQSTGPYPAVVLAVGGFLHTQDR